MKLVLYGMLVLLYAAVATAVGIFVTIFWMYWVGYLLLPGTSTPEQNEEPYVPFYEQIPTD